MSWKNEPGAKKLLWRVHTPELINRLFEIPLPQILRQPVNIFRNILVELADYAQELNDPGLNAIMLRLTLYECADPESPEYQSKVVSEYISKYSRKKEDKK